MADPVRSKVFNAVAEAGYSAPSTDPGGPVDGRGLSVRQIAEQIGEPRRRVRYHLDALREDGIVKVAAERRRKGVVERFFAPLRPPILSDDEIAALPQKQQRKIMLVVIREIFSDVAATLRAPGHAIRRQGWVVARVPGEVDEQGWKELAAHHAESAREAHRIVAESQVRLRKTGNSPIRVLSVNLLLESAPTDHPN